jgi:uncharacterized phage protein (TIGR01671 family)
MNREIKFRAFDKVKGVMSQVLKLDLWGANFEDRKVFLLNGGVSRSSGDYELMQYTGFKDKNEVEIYDQDIIGDFVEVEGKMEQSTQTVYFDEMLGQWMLDNSANQDRTVSYSLFSELQDFEYEVLGNVFENPDLIKNKIS